MKKYFGAALIFCALSAQAAQISLRLEKPKVMLGETVNLEIIVSGQGNLGEPKIAIPSELSVYAQSRSQRVDIVDWKMNSSVIYTLTLVASKADTFSLGPAALDIGGGQMISSEKVTLLVIDQKTPQVPNTPQGVLQPFKQPNFRRSVDEMRKDHKPQQRQSIPAGGQRSAPQAQKQQAAPQAPAGEAPPLSFVETKLDKKKIYVGEPLRYSLLFYTRVPFLSQPQYQPPSVSGFWKEDLPQRTFSTTVNGVAYYATEIPMVLFPTTSGKLEIGSARITLQLESDDPMEFDPFDPQFLQRFLGGGGLGETHVLESKKVALEAEALPTEGRPKDFSGAVGQYEIEAKVDKSEIKVGDTLALTVTISGSGNIKGLPSPTYPNLEGTFRSYETEKSESISKADGQIRGSKVFKLLLIPQVPGRPNLTIPPIRFSYFDPVSKTYLQKESSAISVRVTGEALAQAGSGSKGDSAAQTKELGEDIRYIRAEAPSKSPLDSAAGFIARLWTVLTPFPVILWAASFAVGFARKRRETMGRNPIQKLSSAITAARKTAGNAKVADTVDLLAPAIESAVNQVFRKHGNADPEDKALIKKLLSDLHFFRFAPVKSEEKQELIEDILDRATQVKKILERMQ